MVCAAGLSAVVVIENDPALAAPVPSTVVPSLSYSVTVLPASALPVIVSVGSLEEPLSETVPVTGATSSVTAVIDGAAGAVVSMVTAWLTVGPTLAAASKIGAWKVKLAGCVVSSGRLQVVVVFWTTSVQVVPLLLTWILSPAASAPLVPETVSVVSLVMKSPTVPLSVRIPVIASASAGPAVMMVTWNALEATPWLPAASVAFAVMVCAAWLSAVVVIENDPPIATPVPSTVVPSVSYSVTVLPASAVPLIVSVVSFEEPLSKTVPVTGATSSVTAVIDGAAGAVVSMVTAWLTVVPTLAAASTIRAW